MKIPTRFGSVLLGCAIGGLLGATACGAPARDPSQPEASSPTSAAPTSATPTSDAPTSGGQLDGAALYSANCSGCHGDSMKGKAASDIQKAIDGNIGKMGSLKSLTTAQIDAIAATH